MLEEVGRGWALSGMVDGAAWFSRRLGMDLVWAPAANDQFGNVVLSRLPITSHEVLRPGEGQRNPGRAARPSSTSTRRARTCSSSATHLMNGSQQPMHESRAEAYEAILQKWGGAPNTVLLGDFNTYPRPGAARAGPS